MTDERAIDTWRKKLEFLLREEATVSSADQKFEIRQRIEEARRRIAELEAQGALEADDMTEVTSPRPVPPKMTESLATPLTAENPAAVISGECTFNWLHLTDLHWGQTGQRHLWPEVRHRFFEDLERLAAKYGPWHAVLFSGDLVQKGAKDEFDQLEQRVLGPLWEKFAELGCQPVLLTVPGNHDLARPGDGLTKSLKPALRLLHPDHFGEIAEEFFNDADSPYREIVTTALDSYTNWAQEQPHRQGHPVHTGHFPGDFSTTFELPNGCRVGVVGLNTTFLQLDGGSYEGRLAWDVRQFHGACESDGPAWAEQHDVCLLMTHQGPEWLDERSRKKIYSEINPAGRFAVHQFGHAHAEQMLGRSLGGGILQRLWQGTSLFGLEHYGNDGNEDRRHGYSACSLAFTDNEVTLRRYPRRAVRDNVNGWRFVPDNENCVLEGECTRPESIPLRRPTTGRSKPVPIFPETHTTRLLRDYHTFVRQRWERRWSDDGSESRPPFIESQELSLLLETRQPQQYLRPEYFRAGRGSRTESEERDHGQWGTVDRAEIVGNELTNADGSLCDLSRLVITTDAGVGKTTAMEWLEAEMSEAGSSTAAFMLTFSHLPSRAEDLLPELARRLLPANGNGHDAASLKIALQVLVSLQSQGRLVLLLDALDQEPPDGSAAKLVRQLLDDGAWRGCRIVISGRPHALQRHWSQLFATERGYGWRFVKVEEFASDEQRRFLGVDDDGQDRIDSIPAEAQEILSTPRVLSYLRELPDTDLKKVQTAGDVYWLSVQHLLVAGMQGSESARRIGLDPAEPAPGRVQARSKRRALKVLAAIAFEMTSTLVPRSDSARAAPNFDGVPQSEFEHFRERLLDRVSRASGITGADVLLDKDLDGLAALNEFISQGLFDTTVEGLQEVFWRNRTLQEFFAALWLARYCRPEDTAPLWDWLYLPDRPETEEYYWVWRFLCEMHADGRDPESWLLAVEPIYRPGDGTVEGTRRSSELIYRAWTPLTTLVKRGERKAIELRDRFQGEFETECLSDRRGKAVGQAARELCDSLLDVPAGKFRMGSPKKKQGMDKAERVSWTEYLDEAGDPQQRAQQHIAEWNFTPGKRGEEELQFELEWWTEVFRDKDAKRVEERLYSKDETPAKPVQNVDAFQLSRCPTLNSWYRLFVPGHGEVESSYREKYEAASPTPDCPVIFVSWYDAWAFALWACWDGHSCRLPREYEWEYAAKAGTAWDQNYWWGDDFDADKCNAEENVGRATPPTADHANPWGFEDILGNVLEWCDDWYWRVYDRNAVAEACARVSRGGGWASVARSCRAAYRDANGPASRYGNLGFRLAAVPLGGAGSKEK